MFDAEAVLPRGNVSEHDAHSSDVAMDSPTLVSTEGFGSMWSCLEQLKTLLLPPIVLVRTKQVCQENKMSDPNAPAPRGLLNWWQGLILAVCSAIVGVAGAVAIQSGTSSGMGSGPSWAMMALRFVPHFLLMFGVLADAFTYEGVYWTGTAVGILAIFAGPLLDLVGQGISGVGAKLFGKGTPAVTTQGGGEYPGCEIMSEKAVYAGSPQTLTVTASILSYYILDLVTNLSLLDAAGAIVAGIALFAGQVAAISDAACVKDRVAMAAFMAGLYGIIIGGISFTIIGSWAPNYLPSSVISSNGPGRSGAGGGKASKEGMGMSSGSALAGGTGNPASASTCNA